MCLYCDMSAVNVANVEHWADSGAPYTRLSVLARPTAKKYPNTYVFIFESAMTVGGAPRHVYVDVHYQGNSITPGASMVAIGGLWMPGIQGGMKPTQHGGELLRQLKAELPSNAPRGGVSGIWGDTTGTAPLPNGLTHEAGAPKDLYPVTGWGNATPPKWK